MDSDRETPLFVPKRGWKTGWELLPMSPSSLNRLCDALDLGFSAVSDPLRAYEAFQSIPTSCPFGRSLQLSFLWSPLQGGQSAWKGGSSSGAHRGNPVTSRNHHDSCCFRLTFCGFYYSFHSWPCFHFYYYFHVKEEILLMNLCLWSLLCTPLPRSARCCGWAADPATTSPLCDVLNPDKAGWLPQGKAVFGCAVLPQDSILGRFQPLTDKDTRLSRPAWLSLPSWKLSSNTRTMSMSKGVHKGKTQTKQRGIAAKTLSLEMQKALVFPNAVFKKKKISPCHQKTSENQQIRTQKHTHPWEETLLDSSMWTSLEGSPLASPSCQGRSNHWATKWVDNTIAGWAPCWHQASSWPLWTQER